MDRTAICNVCSLRFLPQSLTMLWSLQRHWTGFETHIFVSDVTAREGATLAAAWPDVRFHFIDQFADRTILDNALLLTDLEFNISLKAMALRVALETGAAKALYCDSDLLFLAAPEAALAALDDHTVVLTPHQLSFQDDASDFAMARTGIFNSGFIGVQGAVGLAFAQWWEDKCARYCLLEPEEGIFVDQKWLDLAVGLFPGTQAFRDPGYNLAYWNIASRGFNSQTVVVHLSGLNPARPAPAGSKLSKYSSETVDNALAQALVPYLKEYAEIAARISTLLPGLGVLPPFGRLAASTGPVVAKRYSAQRFMLEFENAIPRRKGRTSPAYAFQRLHRTDVAVTQLTRRLGAVLVKLGLGSVLEKFIALFRVLGRRGNWLK